MDYFHDAFGGFRPDKDEDAALKFSLCVMAMDNRMDDLLRLVEGGGNFGGVEGDPGWIIQRRDDEDVVGYEEWPANARFRAYVAPEGYSLSSPVFFATRQTFFEYVGRLIGAYKRRNPERVEMVRRIEEVLARVR